MEKKWTLKGFADMAKGTFENAGQNLYVSQKGVLQRIWQFDVNSGSTPRITEIYLA